MAKEQEPIAGELVEANSEATTPAITHWNPAEVDVQVSTAKNYPRTISVFKKKAMDMATLDEETAASCTYAIPRAGKIIEGPSVRLAEIVAPAWGNMRIEAKVTGDDYHFVYAEGTCWDLETNVAYKVGVKRRITNKYGKRYDHDMIGVTGMATTKIALRNAVFTAVPGPYWKAIYQAARMVSAGDIKTLAHRRGEAIGYFKQYGITEERVLHTLRKAKLEDVDLEDVATLRGLATAVKDREIDIDAAFPDPAEQERLDKELLERASSSQSDKLVEKLKTDPIPEPKASDSPRVFDAEEERKPSAAAGPGTQMACPF